MTGYAEDRFGKRHALAVEFMGEGSFTTSFAPTVAGPWVARLVYESVKADGGYAPLELGCAAQHGAHAAVGPNCTGCGTAVEVAPARARNAAVACAARARAGESFGCAAKLSDAYGNAVAGAPAFEQLDLVASAAGRMDELAAAVDGTPGAYAFALAAAGEWTVRARLGGAAVAGAGAAADVLVAPAAVSANASAFSCDAGVIGLQEASCVVALADAHGNAVGGARAHLRVRLLFEAAGSGFREPVSHKIPVTWAEAAPDGAAGEYAFAFETPDQNGVMFVSVSFDDARTAAQLRTAGSIETPPATDARVDVTRRIIDDSAVFASAFACAPNATVSGGSVVCSVSLLESPANPVPFGLKGAAKQIKLVAVAADKAVTNLDVIFIAEGSFEAVLTTGAKGTLRVQLAYKASVDLEAAVEVAAGPIDVAQGVLLETAGVHGAVVPAGGALAASFTARDTYGNAAGDARAAAAFAAEATRGRDTARAAVAFDEASRKLRVAFGANTLIAAGTWAIRVLFRNAPVIIALKGTDTTAGAAAGAGGPRRVAALDVTVAARALSPPHSVFWHETGADATTLTGSVVALHVRATDAFGNIVVPSAAQTRPGTGTAASCLEAFDRRASRFYAQITGGRVTRQSSTAVRACADDATPDDAFNFVVRFTAPQDPGVLRVALFYDGARAVLPRGAARANATTVAVDVRAPPPPVVDGPASALCCAEDGCFGAPVAPAAGGAFACTVFLRNATGQKPARSGAADQDFVAVTATDAAGARLPATLAFNAFDAEAETSFQITLTTTAAGPVTIAATYARPAGAAAVALGAAQEVVVAPGAPAAANTRASCGDAYEAGKARRSSAEHLIATKALRLHSYGLDAHCR